MKERIERYAESLAQEHLSKILQQMHVAVAGVDRDILSQLFQLYLENVDHGDIYEEVLAAFKAVHVGRVEGEILEAAKERLASTGF